MPKINEMTREELRDYMKASREIHSFDIDSKPWKRAFQLAHQSGMENMDMQCTKCISKVREWLMQCLLILMLFSCAKEEPQPVTGSVNYTVSATDGTLNISYQQGTIKNFDLNAGSWSFSFVGKNLEPAYISATSSASTSTVVVTISFRGKVIATNTGKGKATASAQLQ